jgi:hypothetical protein
MNDLDCYLFIDMEVPEEDRVISAMCIECHDDKMPDTGAFYNGSKQGYSNYDWKCCLCGKLIHKADDSEEYYEEESETSSEDPRE